MAAFSYIFNIAALFGCVLYRATLANSPTVFPLCREEDETMQHFILHCSELESTRASFISALCDLVVCEDNEELLGLILDPSTACTLEENSDSGETQIFSLARGLCYALHVRRNTLLASV